MKKRILTLLLAFLLVFPQPALAAVEKNETVYCLLANDGTVKEVKVVNWAYGEPKGDSWTDYGSYSEVKNSTSGSKPKVEGKRLIWPATAFQEDGLFYQGSTEKELPFKVKINYTLDGEPIQPEQLAGEKGKVKITIHLENLTRQQTKLSYKDYQGIKLSTEKTLYTPFVFQVSTSLPAGKWKNIKSPGASQVVVGDKIQLGWMVFPFPTADITLEMRGEEIELEPFEIVALPSVSVLSELDLSKFNIKGKLSPLFTGLVQLESSLGELSSAARKIGENQKKIADGCSQLSTGLQQLEDGVKTSCDGSGELAAGLEQLSSEHQKLAESSSLLKQQIVPLLKQIKLLSPDNEQQIDLMIKGIEGLNDGIAQEKEYLNQLSAAASGLNSGLAELNKGIQSLSQQTPALSSGLDQLAKGQEQLAEGISAAADGVSTMRNEAGGQYNELMSSLAAIDELEVLADNYKSFMDNTNNQNSKVQFLLRTEGIKMEQAETEPVPEEQKKSMWELIISFFQRFFN
ncbi:MAG TPA: hypothetical protein GX502_00550 [Syntrophaceticus sp.]|nr:hypothetical protein [Syntrophaceticus sp.]